VCLKRFAYDFEISLTHISYIYHAHRLKIEISAFFVIFRERFNNFYQEKESNKERV
jgi:hypothetical protein